MAFIQSVIEEFLNHYSNPEIHLALIVTVLLVVAILVIFEYLIYHLVLRRSLYNKAFNICIALIPFFISTIILCLQSNLIITLGTIGALAIIRFRTAVKDPIDMIFLLWSIHIGIVCGCQLYELGVITSIAVTIILIILNNINIDKKSHILVLNCRDLDIVAKVENSLKKESFKYRIKSRSSTNKGVNLVVEVLTKNTNELAKNISAIDGVEKYSLMEHDTDDVL